MYKRQSADPVAFYSGNDERMRIDSNGKIFMNEGVPFSWTDSSLNVSAEIYGDSSDNLVFRNTSAKTERMRIDSSGNVGIGTTSLFGKLSVNSNGAPASSGNMSTGLTVHNGTGGTAINVGTYDAGGYSYIQSSYVNNAGVARDLAFFTGSSEKMLIDSAGKIAIGNNVPMWSGSYGGGLFLKGNNATNDRYAQLAIVDSTGAIAHQGLKINNDGSSTFSGSVALSLDSAQLQFGADNDMQMFHNGAKGEINIATGNFDIDSAGEITLDADTSGIIRLKDGGTEFGKISQNSNNLRIFSSISDGDILLQGNDGGSTITALTLDMSEAGEATFNSDIKLGDGKVARFGNDQDFRISFDGHGIIQNLSLIHI